MKHFVVFLMSLILWGTAAHANQLNFLVTAVVPTTYYTKAVNVEIAAYPTFYSYGWTYFYLNIDGYNYPITGWNSVATSPVSFQAWFNVPNTWSGLHRLQLVVLSGPQIYYSYPQIYNF